MASRNHKHLYMPGMIALLCLAGCMGSKPTAANYLKSAKAMSEQTKRGYFNDWCRIAITMNSGREEYLLSGENSKESLSHINEEELRNQCVFHIQIENVKDIVGPLRYVCANLPEYQALYSYLLNEAKNDFYIRCGDETLHPILYWYTNNYNAFPMDEIKVVFKDVTAKQRKDIEFIYVDKIFLKDTLVFRPDVEAMVKDQSLVLKTH